MNPKFNPKCLTIYMQVSMIKKNDIEWSFETIFPIIAIHKYNWCETRVGSMSIPARVEFCLPLLLLHYDSNYWENPEEFNPVRFTKGLQNIAFLEAKFALAMILQHFSFQLSPSYALAPSNCTIYITLMPQHAWSSHCYSPHLSLPINKFDFFNAIITLMQ